jgi:hypothetical protein
MKRPMLPILLTSALLLAGTVSTASAARGDHDGRRDHEAKTLRMHFPEHGHWRERDAYRDRHHRKHHGRHERHYRAHRHDHRAYRPHYYRTWRPEPRPRLGQWGLQLFYLD